MNSILVIHIWLGPLPNYFDLWKHSCESNKSIQFLLCTDQEVVPSENFLVCKTDLHDLRRRASEYLNFEACMPTPRKLCDYKGIFGYMFSEYISNYDFWGYCDCDLIFGDIRSFLTEDILNNFDYILGMGHFHIQRTDDPKFRNVLETATGIGKIGYWAKDFNANKFLKDKGLKYDKVFTDPNNHIFDEWPYGIAAKYLELYPSRVWTGFTEFGRCFEEPEEWICPFRDLFNDDERYTNSYFPSLSQFFPIWRRSLKSIKKEE